MVDYIEYNPKAHGRKPPFWTPEMPTSIDGENFFRVDRAWISGTTYLVPREAVFGPDYERTQVEREIAVWLRGFSTKYTDELAQIVEEGGYRD